MDYKGKINEHYHHEGLYKSFKKMLLHWKQLGYINLVFKSIRKSRSMLINRNYLCTFNEKGIERIL